MNRIRVIESRIPPRLRGLRLDSPEVAQMRVTPRDRVDRWVASVRAGEVVQAEGHYRTCGKGIWAVGGASTAFLAACLLDLLEEDSTGASVLYLTADDFLDSSRPDNDPYFAESAAEVHILLLAYVPNLRFVTDWGRNAIASLLIKRFDAGLPTLVSTLQSDVRPSDYLGEGLALEIFLGAEIMDPS